MKQQESKSPIQLTDHLTTESNLAIRMFVDENMRMSVPKQVKDGWETRIYETKRIGDTSAASRS